MTRRVAPESPVPRLALTVSEAAAAIAVSPDFFTEYVAPDLRMVRRGRKRLVPVTELQRWLDTEASVALEQDR